MYYVCQNLIHIVQSLSRQAFISLISHVYNHRFFSKWSDLAKLNQQL